VSSVATVSVVWFTSTSWRRDQVSAPYRPTSWQTFLRAHWGAIAGADFFTTDVWTWRGLVTYYTLFVIDLASRRVDIVGSTPYPDDVFMRQVGRTLTAPMTACWSAIAC
jgi:hypothetical protein